MPIDPTEPATPTGTDRRAFLTRSAAGGALVAAATATGFTGLGLGTAAAQGGATSDGAPLTATQEFAAVAAPLELAASVAYNAALSGDAIGGELSETLRQFQRNHQDTASYLTSMLHADAEQPLADPAVVAQFSPADGAGEEAIVTQLASLEEALSATHLSAIANFDDTSFAKALAQVVATESQQAVTLGRAGGESVESLTPAVATTDGALEPGQTPAPTTGEDAEPDTGSGSDTDGTTSGTDGSDAGAATDSGNETDTGEDDTGVNAPGTEGADADSGTGSDTTN